MPETTTSRCKHNGTTFRANEHANTKLATKYFHVQSDANPNQANRHWICFSFRLRFVFANTIQSEMEKSQKTASLLNFPSRFFKFCPPVSTIFRRVYLCSPRGLLFTSPLLLCENTISPKCQYFMNQWKKKSETLLKSYISFGSVQTRGERWSSPALQKSSSDTRELRLEDT